MRELALHILDIVQNSVRAQASMVLVEINENPELNELTITIVDDGTGMTPEQVEHVKDPFFTSRTTRKVGFGIPFFRDTAQQSGGDLEIESELGTGTEVTARMKLDHINLLPLGNMAETMEIIILSNPEINFIYRHIIGVRIFELNTANLTQFAGPAGVDFQALRAMKQQIEQGVTALRTTSTV